MTFVFNRNYKDLAQVEPFYDSYRAVFDELIAAGQYPYNDSFKGRIAGLDAATSKDEDSAIYLLQTLRKIKDMEAEVAEWRELGAIDLVQREFVAALDAETRFDAVIEYGFYVGGTGLHVHRNCRVRPFGGGLQLVPFGKRNGSPLASPHVIGVPAT